MIPRLVFSLMVLSTTSAADRLLIEPINGHTAEGKSTRINAATHAKGIKPVIVDEAKFRVIIMDTGFSSQEATSKVRLCKTGHFNFVNGLPQIGYVHPHGTQIASIIADKLKDVDYCVVVYTIFTELHGQLIDMPTWQPLLMASRSGATAINMSFSGSSTDIREVAALEETARKGVVMFVASGNSNRDLTAKCDAFPACYQIKKLVVVGSQDDDNPKRRASYSNYGGPTEIYAPGMYVEDGDHVWHGTSYAAPRALSDYILFLNRRKPQTRSIQRLSSN